jgi:hypothetical protein
LIKALNFIAINASQLYICEVKIKYNFYYELPIVQKSIIFMKMMGKS